MWRSLCLIAAVSLLPLSIGEVSDVHGATKDVYLDLQKLNTELIELVTEVQNLQQRCFFESVSEAELLKIKKLAQEEISVLSDFKRKLTTTSTPTIINSLAQDVKSRHETPEISITSPISNTQLLLGRNLISVETNIQEARYCVTFDPSPQPVCHSKFSFASESLPVCLDTVGPTAFRAILIDEKSARVLAVSPPVYIVVAAHTRLLLPRLQSAWATEPLIVTGGSLALELRVPRNLAQQHPDATLGVSVACTSKHKVLVTLPMGPYLDQPICENSPGRSSFLITNLISADYEIQFYLSQNGSAISNTMTSARFTHIQSPISLFSERRVVDFSSLSAIFATTQTHTQIDLQYKRKGQPLLNLQQSTGDWLYGMAVNPTPAFSLSERGFLSPTKDVQWINGPSLEIIPDAVVFGLSLSHDANACVCVGGEVLAVLEFERFSGERYHWALPFLTRMERDLRKAVSLLQKLTSVDHFDFAVLSDSARETLPQFFIFDVLQSIVRAEQWVLVDHHVAHAVFGFYDSPFSSALVLAFDGGGSSANTAMYYASTDTGLSLLSQDHERLVLGLTYNTIGAIAREVSSSGVEFLDLSIAGTAMSYAALGKVREEWVPFIRDWYYSVSTELIKDTFRTKLGVELDGEGNVNNTIARDLIATSQHVFEEMTLQLISSHLEALTMNMRKPIDGIVMSGGCALNVKAVDLVRNTFGLPVHIPCAPNDEGLSVGAAWSLVSPLPGTHQNIGYIGFPLWDLDELPDFIERHSARPCTVDELANLLLEGGIVGVLHGRQEFGPRALGHRSFMAYPNTNKIKDQLNTIKGRQSYRPVAPMIIQESSHVFFGNDSVNIVSPYMSMAPRMLPSMQKMFPAVSHLDGTARVQTVSPSDDVFTYRLLARVGDRTGYPILANTSFNVKGKPMCNSIAEALLLLREQDALHAVYIEGYLFTK